MSDSVNQARASPADGSTEQGGDRLKYLGRGVCIIGRRLRQEDRVGLGMWQIERSAQRVTELVVGFRLQVNCMLIPFASLPRPRRCLLEASETGCPTVSTHPACRSIMRPASCVPARCRPERAAIALQMASAGPQPPGGVPGSRRRSPMRATAGTAAGRTPGATIPPE